MRAMLRTGPVLLATVLLVLAPSISPGGITDKGPFNIDPEQEEANTNFLLDVSGEDCHDPDLEPDNAESSSTSSSGEPEAVLLGGGFPTDVHVQVLSPDGNTVITSETFQPDQLGPGSGDWEGTLGPLNLAIGTYPVTAECRHALTAGSSEGDEASSSSTSGPVFVLLGNGEEPRCTEAGNIETPGNLGPGCYQPQELEIVAREAGPAEAEQEEPTFTG